MNVANALTVTGNNPDRRQSIYRITAGTRQGFGAARPRALPRPCPGLTGCGVGRCSAHE
jgi:hypothetical protein